MITCPAASIVWRHICCLPRRHGGSSGRLFSDGLRLHRECRGWIKHGCYLRGRRVCTIFSLGFCCGARLCRCSGGSLGCCRRWHRPAGQRGRTICGLWHAFRAGRGLFRSSNRGRVEHRRGRFWRLCGRAGRPSGCLFCRRGLFHIDNRGGRLHRGRRCCVGRRRGRTTCGRGGSRAFLQIRIGSRGIPVLRRDRVWRHGGNIFRLFRGLA